MRAPLKFGILFLILMIVSLSLLARHYINRGFSALDPPSVAETYIARGIRRVSIPGKAKESRNPVSSSPEVLAGAMEHFADHCAICHGNDGKGKTLIGKGLYPKPPDMSLDETQRLTDGELYYIIQNGVRLTGMPAFGEAGTNEPDEESWALVYFIRHLPSMTVEEEQQMKAMNPKSPAELAKEERLRQFLEGNDNPSPGINHDHHH
jgi:mono/diheme cytochrome c family protein